MKFQAIIPFSCLLFLLSSHFPAEAQLRRPGFVTIEREDRNKSKLIPEKGAIYLDGMVADKVVVRITKTAPIYSTLSADRWMGNLLENQNAELLAVSEKAYRVRGKAKQGQVAGWVSKAAVTGLPESFEANLKHYYERYQVVKELIDNHQVALGMTVDEVIASIGPPDKRSSKVDTEGRTDTLEYISYERVPQTGIGYDSFGHPVPVTQYVEVESGRVTIDLTNNTVSSIQETEGIDLANNAISVPTPVYLF